MINIEIEIFTPSNRRQWRQWLQKNHTSKQSVWLLLHKKESNIPTISWDEAVDEALCFGWIDSKRKPVDKEKFMQFFSKRNPKGTWSRVNKEKASRLMDSGLMTKAGVATIEAAKQNGSWTILDEVEELKIPADLARSFKTKPVAKEYFLSLSKSVRKRMLQWIALARLEETRRRRIEEIIKFSDQKTRPPQFR